MGYDAGTEGAGRGGSVAAGLQVLPRDECLRLLATVSVGRIGVSIDALPAILPVNFVVAREEILIRSVPGSKLDAAITQAVVAFEADDFASDGSWGWSVLVRGQGSEVTDPDEVVRVRRLPLHAWAFGDEAADRFVRIGTTLVSGRRFGSG